MHSLAWANRWRFSLANTGLLKGLNGVLEHRVSVAPSSVQRPQTLAAASVGLLLVLFRAMNLSNLASFEMCLAGVVRHVCTPLKLVSTDVDYLPGTVRTRV